jgi:metal-sulfur cluster biosynthetic enzyme
VVTEEKVRETLQEVYDPEIPINVVDLGLIYKIEVEGDKVKVDMTMTARGCPMHGYIAEETRKRLLRIEGVKEAEVNIVWEPAWNPTMISEEARKRLGLA